METGGSLLEKEIFIDSRKSFEIEICLRSFCL